MGNTGIINNLFKQIFKAFEKSYDQIAGFDMGYVEIKDLCRKAWKIEEKKRFNIKRSERTGVKYCNCNENRPGT